MGLRPLLAVAGLLYWPACPARADAPPLPPHNITMAKDNGRCIVRSRVDTRQTFALRVTNGRADFLWSVPGWHPSFFVTDDCRILVIVEAEGNLLRLDQRRPDTVVLRLFKDGAVFRTVRLGDIYADLSPIMRTVSHFVWLRAYRMRQDAFVLQTNDGRTVRIPFGE